MAYKKNNSILIIVFSEVSRDPRVIRQIETLSNRFEVTVAGFGEQPAGDIKYVRIRKDPSSSLYKKAFRAARLITGSYESYYWKLPYVRAAVDAIREGGYDLVIANDISTLPLALEVADGKPVLFDAHEYYPRQYEDS